jgi:hypothetical protein
LTPALDEAAYTGAWLENKSFEIRSLERQGTLQSTPKRAPT